MGVLNLNEYRTTEWIGLIGSYNRQEIRPLACSFALLIALLSTRTLIASWKKNALDQLKISILSP